MFHHLTTKKLLHHLDLLSGILEFFDVFINLKLRQKRKTLQNKWFSGGGDDFCFVHHWFLRSFCMIWSGERLLSFLLIWSLMLWKTCFSQSLYMAARWSLCCFSVLEIASAASFITPSFANPAKIVRINAWNLASSFASLAAFNSNNLCLPLPPPQQQTPTPLVGAIHMLHYHRRKRRRRKWWWWSHGSPQNTMCKSVEKKKLW